MSDIAVDLPVTVLVPNGAGCWPMQSDPGYPSGFTFKDIERVIDKQRRTHVVYFIFCAGFVKIGTTSSLKRRMSELQIGAPWQTRIVGLVLGGKTIEAFLHFVFREDHIGGEWFRLGPALRQGILDCVVHVPALQGLLEEEEAEYKAWIAEEALRLGLTPTAL